MTGQFGGKVPPGTCANAVRRASEGLPQLLKQRPKPIIALWAGRVVWRVVRLRLSGGKPELEVYGRPTHDEWFDDGTDASLLGCGP